MPPPPPMPGIIPGPAVAPRPPINDRSTPTINQTAAMPMTAVIIQPHGVACSVCKALVGLAADGEATLLTLVLGSEWLAIVVDTNLTHSDNASSFCFARSLLSMRLVRLSRSFNVKALFCVSLPTTI